MSGFRITPRARDDLKNIGRYTQKTWGKAQRDKYLLDMDQRFDWLSKRPEVGRIRDDIAQEHYCYSQGSHLIFYTISDDFISIIGVVHQDMDVINYFPRLENSNG